MLMMATVAATCWLCALIATPRRPLLNNEVQELVYTRLLGRQHLLMLLALAATAGTFLVFTVGAVPGRGNADLDLMPAAAPTPYMEMFTPSFEQPR
ncbi:MAG: hypothetical protein M3008_13260 [Chloroflexota bacterium]|nr:hypothetical protein [Chloroflexota bacterium]